MYFLIQHAPIRWPDLQRHGISVSEEAKDLISRLLIRDRKQRLGQKGDMDEVFSHPFFANLDLEKLIKKELEAPFKPAVNEGLLDLTNFDSKFVKFGVKESMLPDEGKEKIMQK